MVGDSGDAFLAELAEFTDGVLLGEALLGAARARYEASGESEPPPLDTVVSIVVGVFVGVVSRGLMNTSP